MPPKAPMPDAVASFRAQYLAPGVFEAMVQMADAERRVKRLRPLTSVEDRGNREGVLVLHRTADKVVSSHAERVGSHLRSLS